MSVIRWPYLLPSFLALALFLHEAFAPTAVRAADYTRSSINLPASTTSFNTAYDLDGDGRRDVIAIFQRRVLLFFQTAAGTFPTQADVEIGAGKAIPTDYAAISVAKVTADPGQQVLLLGRGGVDYVTVPQLRGETGQPVEPQPLIEGNFELTSQPDLAFLNAAIDTNESGRAELFLPDGRQLALFRPGAQGKYTRSGGIDLPLKVIQRTRLDAEPPLLGSPLHDAAAARELVQTLPRLGDRWHAVRFSLETLSDPFLFVDYNQDRRLDALFPQQALMQSASGQFQPQKLTALSRIAQATYVSDGRAAPAPNLSDFNGDGILDTFKIVATAARLSPRTDLLVYLGRADRTFPDSPDSVLRTRDFAYSEVIPMGDLNKDGCIDCALIHLDFQPSSASSQFRAYLKNGLSGDLRFYLWDKKRNRFPESHSFSQPITISYDIYGSRQLFRRQIAMDRDMDGDELPDLVLKTGAQEVSIYKNEVPGRNRFSANPVSVINTAPVRFSSLRLDDLNNDKRGDLIITGYQEGADERLIYSVFTSR